VTSSILVRTMALVPRRTIRFVVTFVHADQVSIEPNVNSTIDPVIRIVVGTMGSAMKHRGRRFDVHVKPIGKEIVVREK
jgi:hypothetical protein